jgi:serine/threonine-protein kinase
VLDFGIARAPVGTDLKLTQTQSLLGTPAYMSPEQMRSARMVDARSDIWSLGTVMYELIEGRRPFEAESFSEMCVKVAVDAPTPMKNAPPPLQEVIMRCLAKSPEQRYANMAELGNALRPFMRDPKTAGILVERMHRMIERGVQIDWASGTPLPAPAAGGTSAAAPQGAQGAEAAAAAAAAAPARSIADEEPIPAKILQPPRGEWRTLDEVTLKGPPRRKSGLVFVGVAALLGIAIGLTVFIANGGLRGGTDPDPAEDQAPVAAPAATPAPAPAPVTPPQIPLDHFKEVGPPEAKAPGAKTPEVKPTPEKRPMVRKPPKQDPKVHDAPPPPPAEDCIPADHPHGCPKP